LQLEQSFPETIFSTCTLSVPPQLLEETLQGFEPLYIISRRLTPSIELWQSFIIRLTLVNCPWLEAPETL